MPYVHVSWNPVPIPVVLIRECLYDAQISYALNKHLKLTN